MKSNNMGIVYLIEGTAPGSRIYQVERYEIKRKAIVELKMSDEGEILVYVAGAKRTITDITTYEEKVNKEIEKGLSKIAFYIQEFRRTISSFLFRGGKIFSYHFFMYSL